MSERALGVVEGGETGVPPEDGERFDPRAHFRALRGKGGQAQDYLDVKWRLVWFRETWPYGTIDTEVVELAENRAVFRATVCGATEDGAIRGRATGYGSETANDFGDFIEKAETKAIGRALNALGYGAANAMGDDDQEAGGVTNAPIERRQPASSPPATTRPSGRDNTAPGGATDKQKNFLRALWKGIGKTTPDGKHHDGAALDAFLYERGLKMDTLPASEATRLIDLWKPIAERKAMEAAIAGGTPTSDPMPGAAGMFASDMGVVDEAVDRWTS